MKSFIGILAMTVVFVVASIADASAQARKPQGSQRSLDRSAVEQQLKGNFPKLVRETLPLGAINQVWAGEKCGQDSTTVAIGYNPGSEIRFRIRQLLGTIVAFPEPVELVSEPGGTGFNVKPHGEEGVAANLWIFGTTKAGLDGNYVFVGKGSGRSPVLYLLHVQAEGYNTKNCPDLMVLVRPSVASGIGKAATALQEWMTAMQPGQGVPIRTVPVKNTPNPDGSIAPKNSAVPSTVKPSNTGRGGQDWLEQKAFDPSKLKFNWRVYGEPSLAPDVVYSDGVFTYLKFSEERIEGVRIAAISAVEKTKRGSIDSMVNWSFKGDTIVVQGIQRLTLEREGLVTCIVPEGMQPPASFKSAGLVFDTYARER